MRIDHVTKSIIPFAVVAAATLTVQRSFAEEGPEIRAARVCNGLAKFDSQSQGSLKIDNFDVTADSKGTVTITKDGINLATMEKVTYEKYTDCLFKMTGVLSGVK
jgi:hypothetical protein